MRKLLQVPRSKGRLGGAFYAWRLTSEDFGPVYKEIDFQELQPFLNTPRQ